MLLGKRAEGFGGWLLQNQMGQQEIAVVAPILTSKGVPGRCTPMFGPQAELANGAHHE
jgi:hypothetical protein